MNTAVLNHDEQLSSRRVVMTGLLCVVLLYLGWSVVPLLSAGAKAAGAAAAAHEVVEHHEAVHAVAPALFSVLPFAALLMCIALCPLFHRSAHWWEHNTNKLKVAGTFAVCSLLYYAYGYGHGVVNHATHATSEPGIAAALVVLQNALLVEYIPFIVLLFSLYVISGGVAVEGRLVGRPALNTGMLAIGAVTASLVGTTGAAMLLIRPLLKANARRRYVAHTIVFFTFVVCNTGGCLLPIGDPPLFLGYLRGVPFTWTLSLWPQWLFMNASLCAIYYIWDRVNYLREDRSAVEVLEGRHEALGIKGSLNFVWLAGVIACVALLDPSKPVPGTNWCAPEYFREIMMLGLTSLSLVMTPSRIRAHNSFSYDAIVEVAALFVGIFVCMQAPIQILNVHGASLGIDEPWKFYWCTGALSSFLDNAPTYVVFFETAKTLPQTGASVAGVGVASLSAISLGAVFMGAMTYIGNGPNFMVKTIAEKNNVKMPSFFGYMLYSGAVLLPLSLVMTWIFF
jgi:Na+/H+ antiporter NhaD/arsenite permease-like protein